MEEGVGDLINGPQFETCREIYDSKHVYEALSKLLGDAGSLKDKGNSLYTSREYDAAEAFYARGFDIITMDILPRWEQFRTDETDSNNGTLNGTLQEDESIKIFENLLEETKRIYASLISNLILTKISMRQLKDAEFFASSFLEEAEVRVLDPNPNILKEYCRSYPKLWYRRAQAREALRLFQQSESDYSICLSLLQKRSSEVHHMVDMNKMSREIRDVMSALRKVRLEMNKAHSDSLLGMATPLENAIYKITAKNQRQMEIPASPEKDRGGKESTCHNSPRLEATKGTTPQQQYNKRIHESAEILSSGKISLRPPNPPRPSPDMQRSLILQLMAQTSNINRLHDLGPQDTNEFKRGTVSMTSESANDGHSSNSCRKERCSIRPGEAYYIIDFDWWRQWCLNVNLFFDKEYSAILKTLSDATAAISPEHVLQKYHYEKEFLERKRMDIAHLLPPGSFIPTIDQSRSTSACLSVKQRSNSISSESCSSRSSGSSFNGKDDNSQDSELSCIDNSGLLLYYKDFQIMGSDYPNLKDNISSSKELLYWDWRHRQIFASICKNDFSRDPNLQLPFLRPRLVRGYHYEILSREVYAALVCWYGEITPSICRRTVDSKETGRPSILLYPELHIELSIIEPSRHYCSACGSSRALFRCRNCSNVYYCDQSCQVSHWQYHKDECKKFSNHKNNQNYSNGFKYSSDCPPWTFNALGIRPMQGRMGLNNLGNTCFMNAALQCLSHATPLTRYFLSDRFKLDLNIRNPLGTGGKLAYAYEYLVKELWMGAKSNTSPTKLKRAIAIFAPQFAGSQQHDSQEFLAFLLDGLHEDLNLVKNPPYVVIPDFTIDKDLYIAGAEAWDAYSRRNDSLLMGSFYGQFKSTCVCPNPQCARVSVSYEAFNHISLEIPQNTGKEILLVLFKAQSDITLTSTPMKYLVQVPRNACWRDLKESLSNLSGVPLPRLTVCDIYENEIYEIFEDHKSVMNVQLNDTIIAFEIDPYSKSTIHAITTHVRVPLEKNWVGSTSSGKSSFGYPLLTSFDASRTCHEVWEHLWKQVSYLFSDVQNKDLSAQVRVRVVRKDGSPLDVFPSMDCASSILPRYSKTRLSTYLGPACTERFLFLHLEWAPNSEDNLHDDIFTHERFIRTEKHSSVVDSSFLGRKQHLKGCVTLERCFENFALAERLDQYNQWYCSMCKEHVRAMKTIEIWNVPNILIVHFKRFEYMHAFRREKIDTLVEFPLENLDMTKFCGSAESGDNKDSFVDHKVPAIYDLFGVVNHYGRLGFGHYLASCRRFSDTYIENDWFSFDDSVVQEIPDTSIVSPSAYVLFYRRRIFA